MSHSSAAKASRMRAPNHEAARQSLRTSNRSSTNSRGTKVTKSPSVIYGQDQNLMDMLPHDLTPSSPVNNNDALGPVTEAPITLLAIIHAIRNDNILTADQRKDWAAALRTALKKLKFADLSLSALQPEADLERFLTRFDKTPTGLKAGNIRNIRHRCRKALRHYLALQGHSPAPKVNDFQVPADWQPLADILPKEPGFSPKRFIMFAEEHGLLPADIGDLVVERFGHTISDMKHPQLHLRKLIKLWNLAAEQQNNLSLQKLTLTCNRQKTYAVRLEDLHPELQDDICNYLAYRSGKMTGDKKCPKHDRLRPNSVEKARSLIRQYLGLLNQAGVAVAVYRSLDEAIIDTNIEMAVNEMAAVSGQETSSQINNMFNTISAIARHWCASWTAPLLAGLRSWFNDEHAHRYTGMTEAKQGQLRAVRGGRERALLLQLPEKLMKLAAQSDSQRGAHLAQRAVAIELLLFTVMRLGNISTLRFDEHIVEYGSGPSAKMHVLVRARDVKNSTPVQVELSTDSAKMLRVYRETYLPRLQEAIRTSYSRATEPAPRAAERSVSRSWQRSRSSLGLT